MGEGLGIWIELGLAHAVIAWLNHCLHLSCDNVHLIITLDLNVGPVTLWTSDL